MKPAAPVTSTRSTTDMGYERGAGRRSARPGVEAAVMGIPRITVRTTAAARYCFSDIGARPIVTVSYPPAQQSCLHAIQGHRSTSSGAAACLLPWGVASLMSLERICRYQRLAAYRTVVFNGGYSHPCPMAVDQSRRLFNPYDLPTVASEGHGGPWSIAGPRYIDPAPADPVRCTVRLGGRKGDT